MVAFTALSKNSVCGGCGMEAAPNRALQREQRETRLFVHPVGGGHLVVAQAFREPHGDFLVGGLDGVRAVDDVAADVNAEVATDGARGGVGGAGLAQQLAAAEDHASACSSKEKNTKPRQPLSGRHGAHTHARARSNNDSPSHTMHTTGPDSM